MLNMLASLACTWKAMATEAHFSRHGEMARKGSHLMARRRQFIPVPSCDLGSCCRSCCLLFSAVEASIAYPVGAPL